MEGEFLIPAERIEKAILFLRGQKVMLNGFSDSLSCRAEGAYPGREAELPSVSR
jgi:hypothetical protein